MAHSLSRRNPSNKKPTAMRRCRLSLEMLEGRVVPSIYTVTNTNDSGPGSLRQAILNVNAQPGQDTIAFDIAGSSVPIIRPTTALPPITNPVVIDGTTQQGSHRVVVNGSHAGAGVSGLTITAGSSTVEGLAIGGFAGDGLVLQDGGGNVIAGNYLGTDFSGSGTFGNGGNGLSIMSVDNLIGGTTPTASNVISGNQESGIRIADGDNNLVEGNFIGTDSVGLTVFANGTGVTVGGMDNTIGGTTAGDHNLISGNTISGLNVAGENNSVQGNYIGVVLPNGTGVTITGRAATIGGTIPGAGNVISINRQSGILIQAAGAVIQGNDIGTDSRGNGALGNAAGIILSGVSVTATLIGGTLPGSRNLISANVTYGILLDGASSNTIQGNYIGLDAGGTMALLNNEGVVVQAGASGNLVGGTAPGAGNVITARQSAASVELTGGATGNRVQGNWLGTDATGTRGVFDLYGVLISDNSPENTVGGTVVGAGNLISASRAAGIGLFDGSNGTVIQGNRIGTDISGTHALANQTGLIIDTSDNVIGGTIAGAGNLISGNNADGIHLGATSNLVEGNQIGTDVIGTHALANQTGIIVAADNNTIGGVAPGAGNLIAGNTGSGVRIDNGASHTTIQGNGIGIDITGARALGNAIGVEVAFGGSNQIGGTTMAAGNVISGNQQAGIVLNTSGNWVQGNRIGTNAAGTAAVSNLTGVLVTASANTVGGTCTGSSNLISGNGSGIQITTPSAAGNAVQGNIIGTDVTGARSLENNFGVYVLNGAHDNTIGGTDAGAGNLISGNFLFGVDIEGRDTVGNVVQGNRIGTDATGSTAVGNTYGVGLAAPNNIVGGTTAAARNIISGNGDDGIDVENFSGNVIAGNYIGTDISGTRVVTGGAQGTGVSVSFAADTIIGGTVMGAGNIISGNTQYGIILLAPGVQILGNYIGTDVTGSRALGGGMYGGIFSEGDHVLIGGNAPGAGNVIAGNGGNGVYISGSANVVQGNYIGTDASGTVALANHMDGVSIFQGTQTLIGGTMEGAGNLISGNSGRGLVVNGSYTTVQGNRIGTDFSGTVALSNGADGVVLINSSHNTVGGTAGAANLIAGNGGSGVVLSFVTTANLVAGNVIGTDPSGTLALGNALDGLSMGASDNTIGGTGPGARNLIAFNGRDGVRVGSGTGNTILRNAIFGHPNGLGINLLRGGNNNQPFPTITSATFDGQFTTIAGTLASAPNTTYTIELFINSVPNPSGYGEGERFFASLTVATDADGNASFDLSLPIEVDPGQFISATATDPNGNTSQFALCVEVTGPGAPVPSLVPPLDGPGRMGVRLTPNAVPVPYSAGLSRHFDFASSYVSLPGPSMGTDDAQEASGINLSPDEWLATSLLGILEAAW